MAGFSGAQLGSSVGPSQADPSSSFDAAALDNGLIFEPDTPDILRRGVHSASKPPSAVGPNKRDQHILQEAHLYDPFIDTSFGNLGLDGALTNDFLMGNDDPNAIPAEFDLGLAADAFGDIGINDGAQFGTGDINFGPGEYVRLFLRSLQSLTASATKIWHTGR